MSGFQIKQKCILVLRCIRSVEMYYFLDWNDEKNLELTISGLDYTELIDTCFKYSTHISFSLRFLRRGGIRFESPEPYAKPLKASLSASCGDTVILPCSEKTRQYLLNRTDNLFKWMDWYKNPEDLTFYRADGSIFFWSLIHEGVCCLINRPDEDVSGVVGKPDWHRCPPEPFPAVLVPNDIADFRLAFPNE